MSLEKRISKLEQPNGPGLVIYITGPFSEDGGEPLIHKALVDGRQLERHPDETQDAFMARVNPTGQRSACLESDTHNL